MLQLLRIIAAAVIVVVMMRSTVRPEFPFCGYSSNRSTCPGDPNQVEIKSPFWIENCTVDETTGRDCIMHPEFQITCAANRRPVINISSSLYHVIGIDYQYDDGGSSLSIVDVDIDAQKCPQPRRNFSIDSTSLFRYPLNSNHYKFFNYDNLTFFYNCSRYQPNVIQHIPCLSNNHYNITNNNSSRGSFAFWEEDLSSHQFDWYSNCEEAVVVPVFHHYGDNDPMNYTRALQDGFIVYYKYPVNCRNCELSGSMCWRNETNQQTATTIPFHCNCTDGYTYEDDICPGEYYNLYYYGPEYNYGYEDHKGISKTSILIIGISVGIGGGVLLILLFIYGERCYSLYNSAVSSCDLLYDSIASNYRKIIKGPTNAEVFIWNNFGGLTLQNYTYSDIKKMTNFFEDTLGQGGFESVFKGKLRDGPSVAVKVLNESKSKCEDFINEVRTIGRTNHVNVVSLLGFCIDGTKQALVYEFMPNGSLEKFIHNAKDSNSTSSFLGWEKLYQIALGIARGLDYLHRGCNTRILHFDIKPHNILLDKDFCPKISDFGLAKLCTTRESFVSMVGARGTPGYIAPEVYCGNFGGVSHKSDVYSFGMMVLEMIGGRKNMDILAENVSQIYFPHWIYKRLAEKTEVEESEDIKVNVVPKEVFKEEIARKMVIVALWCIQAHPGDRPSITKVVELLEGNTEDLQFPPNPFPDPSSNSHLS